MNLSKITTIIFDYDGTLVDSHRLRLETWEQALREFGVEFNTSQLEEVLLQGIENEAVIESIAGDVVNDKTISLVLERRSELRDRAAPSRMFPDVPGTIRRLAADGYRLAICSGNWVRVIIPCLKQLGLWRYFGDDVVFGHENLAHNKPDARALMQVIDALGANPDETLSVGDTPVDCRLAIENDVRFIGINRDPCGSSEFDFPVISTLGELPGMLEKTKNVNN